MTTRSRVHSTSQLVLADATGAYAERAPLLALREHFSRTWFNTFPNSGTPLAVVPDACIDLQWIDGELRVAGPDREVNHEAQRPGARVIGLRFRPGAASQWLGVPASAIVGARVPLEAFWGAEARSMAAWVKEGAQDGAAVVRRLETALARRAPSMPRADPAAFQIRGLLEATLDLRTDVVACLRAELGLSERTLRRRCHELFGYGPKTLQRIVRFQRVLRLAGASSGGAAVASEAGYADQSHLAREARRMAGMTPASIWEQLQQARAEHARDGRSVQDAEPRPGQLV